MKYTLISLMLLFALTKQRPAFGQDKAQLAKVEYEMAEEALAVKNYTEVRAHLDKATNLLGKTNFKIDFLKIQNIYDFLKSVKGEENDKEYFYFRYLTKRSCF